MKEVGVGPQAARVYVPTDPAPDKPLPLVVLLHGFQALSTGYYERWIDHLVRRGAVLVAPVWQFRVTLPDRFLRNARVGIEEALDHIKGNNIPVDLERVAFVGHSGGGTLSINLSVLAARGQLPIRPRAVMVAAPGRCLFCNQLRDPGIPLESLEDVPGDILLAVINSEEDVDVGQMLGRHMYKTLTQIPPGAPHLC